MKHIRFLFLFLLILTATLLISCESIFPSVVDPNATSEAPRVTTGQPAATTPVGGGAVTNVPVTTTEEPFFDPYPNAVCRVSPLSSGGGMLRTWKVEAELEPGYKETFYLRVPGFTNKQVYSDGVTKQVNYFNSLVASRPDVNWMFFVPTSFESTDYGTKAMPFESTQKLVERFTSEIDPRVQFRFLRTPCVYDRLARYYKTDHHWNAFGVLECYYGIADMIEAHYGAGSVTRCENPIYYSFENFNFFGSLARGSNRWDVYDRFDYYDLDLPYHTVEIDEGIRYGARVDLDTRLSQYQNGEYYPGLNGAAPDRNYYHYTEFYRPLKKVVYPGNNTGRVALLVGDSFSLPLLEAVASFFDVTYIRYEDEINPTLTNNPIVYPEFVDEMGITDVIVIEDPNRVMMDGYSSYDGTFRGVTLE